MATPLLCDACGKIVKATETAHIRVGVLLRWDQSNRVSNSTSGYAMPCDAKVDICPYCYETVLKMLPDWIREPVEMAVDDPERVVM